MEQQGKKAQQIGHIMHKRTNREDDPKSECVVLFVQVSTTENSLMEVIFARKCQQEAEYSGCCVLGVFYFILLQVGWKV